MHRAHEASPRRILVAIAMLLFTACRSDIAAPEKPSIRFEPTIDKLLNHALSRTPEVPPGAEVPEPNEPARVTLLSAGAEPRQPLRWTFQPGVVDVHTESVETIEESGKQTHSVLRRARLRVQVLNDDSGARAEVQVVEIAQEGRGPVPAGILDASKHIGATFTVPLSPTGSNGVVPYELLADTSSADRLETWYRTVQGLWPALPEEPVGDGASWRTVASRTRGGSRFLTTHVTDMHWRAEAAMRGQLVSSGLLSSRIGDLPIGFDIRSGGVGRIDFAAHPLQLQLDMRGRARAYQAAKSAKRPMPEGDMFSRIWTSPVP